MSAGVITLVTLTIAIVSVVLVILRFGSIKLGYDKKRAASGLAVGLCVVVLAQFLPQIIKLVQQFLR